MIIETNTAPVKRSDASGTGPFRLRNLLVAALAGLMLSSSAPSAAQEPATVPVASAEAVVDLNTATEAELVSLPGIGPSKAQAILAYRQRRPFRRIEELMRVPGIGRTTFRRLRARLEVSRP